MHPTGRGLHDDSIRNAVGAIMISRNPHQLAEQPDKFKLMSSVGFDLLPANFLQNGSESGLIKDGRMKKLRFTEEQIIAVLKEQEAGAKVANLWRGNLL